MNQNTPIYIKIKEDIINDINNSVLQYGDKLPSERELCLKYQSSRMTVRQAITELIGEGLIATQKGKGSFVTKSSTIQLNLRSFTETVKSQGLVPTTKILEFSTVNSLRKISVLLELPQDTKYYKLKRVRYCNEIAVALETVYIPVMYCINLGKLDLTGSLYKVLEEQYKHKIEKTNCTIEACIASVPLVRIFEREKAFPLLKVDSVAFTKQGEKLFYEEAYYDSAMYKYQVDISGR